MDLLVVDKVESDLFSSFVPKYMILSYVWTAIFNVFLEFVLMVYNLKSVGIFCIYTWNDL